MTMERQENHKEDQNTKPLTEYGLFEMDELPGSK
jgi:hypothetical protein